MAVKSTLQELRMKIVQKGTNSEGESITKNKTISNINPAATDEQILTCGNAIGGIFKETLSGVLKDPVYALSEEA